MVVRGDPFHRTTELLKNPVPVRDNVKAAPPALALDGCTCVIAGTGLVIVKFNVALVPPPGPGLVTVTWAVEAAAMSLARIAAVSFVELT